MSGQRTYWHLQHLGRKPTDYEVASTNLLYHPTRGFEVNVPVAGWHARHGTASPLTCSDWERFRDPDEMTYAKYIGIRRARETFVDGLLASIDASDYDARLAPEWVGVLSQVLAPLRYPVHGLQMAASYLAHMAPSGRIAIAGLFQAADEMRRLQRFAYRMRQLQVTHPGFGDDSRSVWQDDPLWQPWRKAIEHLLVTYDWGECFVALNLVLKPAFDEMFVASFGRLAQARGDDRLAVLLLSLGQDCAWHRAWSRALVQLAVEDEAENTRVIAEWVTRWEPRATAAIAPFAPLF